MDVRGEAGILILALVLIFAPAYIANAEMGRQQTINISNSGLSEELHLRLLPVAWWSGRGDSTWTHGRGAMRVDRDFGADHLDDTNQFGDDLASDSSEGFTDRETDHKAQHWTPGSYGLMGNYSHDER